MAMQTFNGSLWTPAPMPGIAGSIGHGSLPIDAAGEKVAVSFPVPKTGTISRVGFRVGAVPTSQTLRVGLYTTDATLLPTATAYGGMVVGTQASPAANTAYTVALGTGATAVKDEIIAAVIEFDATVGNVSISTVTGSFSTSILFPFVSHYTTSWAKQVVAPLLWLEYSDGTYAYIPNMIPASLVSELTFNLGTAVADEYGLRFMLNFPARLHGWGGFVSQAGNFDATLYEGTTVRTSQSLIANQSAANAARYQSRVLPTPYLLAKDTEYMFTARPTTATSIILAYFDVVAAAVLNQTDGGSGFHMCQRLDQGPWTYTTTRRPLLFLMLDQFSDGVGGASSIKSHPGMRGGMNG